MDKKQLVQNLNNYLKINDYPDGSKNWLQIDTSKTEIKKIWYAVDATSYIFDKAIENNVDMVIVHHGIYWGYEQALVDIHYKRASKLIKNDIALYAAHIPLDAHEEVWNNIWIVKAFTNIFWIRDYKLEQFGDYKWKFIWYGIKFEQEVHIANIITPFCQQMQFEKKLYNFWKKEYIKSVAVISWWAWDDFKQAYDNWYDLYITWEASHNEIIDAKEFWQSILLWWHRETEKIWVKLLANYIEKNFWIETMFLDEKY